MDWLLGIESAWISQLQIPKNNILVCIKLSLKAIRAVQKFVPLTQVIIKQFEERTNTREKYFRLHL